MKGSSASCFWSAGQECVLLPLVEKALDAQGLQKVEGGSAGKGI